MSKVVVFSINQYEEALLGEVNSKLSFTGVKERLDTSTISLAEGAIAIAVNVRDKLDAEVLGALASMGVKMIALRSAGYDHIDMNCAKELGITVSRVPEYSPNAIAEFAVALLLALSRKVLQGVERAKKYNFLQEGLLGFNCHGKTVGIIGAGKIGSIFAKIMLGFGAKVLINDPVVHPDCESLDVTYVDKKSLLQQSDIISLHCLLNEQTKYILDHDDFASMKKGVVIINTGRGALINTQALISALASEKVGGAGLDVYEYEAPLFFADHSQEVIEDELLIRLQGFGNVILTGHLAYFSQEAIEGIVRVTVENVQAYMNDKPINCVE